MGGGRGWGVEGWGGGGGLEGVGVWGSVGWGWVWGCGEGWWGGGVVAWWGGGAGVEGVGLGSSSSGDALETIEVRDCRHVPEQEDLGRAAKDANTCKMRVPPPGLPQTSAKHSAQNRCIAYL